MHLLLHVLLLDHLPDALLVVVHLLLDVLLVVHLLPDVASCRLGDWPVQRSIDIEAWSYTNCMIEINADAIFLCYLSNGPTLTELDPVF